MKKNSKNPHLSHDPLTHKRERWREITTQRSVETETEKGPGRERLHERFKFHRKSRNIDSMTDVADDKCKAEFRFFKNDIHLLGEVLDIPDIMKYPIVTFLWTEWRLKVCRFAELIARFGRP